MALHRGIQSAIFYYLSCAPCTGYSYRQKRRKEATRDRAAKKAMEMEQPGLYRHPSPFATNPHWQTEINLGPSPVPGKRKGAGQKKGRTRTSDDNPSNVASSVNLSRGDSNDSTSNLRSWQREDEDLWGSNHPYRNRRRSSANRISTISRPPTARTNTTDRSGASSYYSTMNPPINDLHPPIVTRMDNREDAMWMLQPPPPARVMRGTERPNGSRHGSVSSSRRTGTEENVSRRPSRHIVDDHLSPVPASKSRDSFRSTDTTHDRDTDPSSSADDLKSKRRRRPPPPINVSEDSGASTPTLVHTTPVLLDSAEFEDQTLMKPSARRYLSPIVSSNASPERSRSRTRDRSSDSQRRPNNARQDSSLNVLQELVHTDSLLNVQKLSKSPSFEARIELPSSDEYEEMILLGSGKAGFDSWYESRDATSFPQWAADRVRRDVSSRWSVDF